MNSQNRYVAILDKLYLEYRDIIPDHEKSKLEFLGDDVFQFTLYDSEIEEEFARNMLEVLKCILERKTFEYINDKGSKYRNYLVMCNMPFLKNRIEWGGSIRGAWFEQYHKEPIPMSYFDEVIEPDTWNDFVAAILEWAGVSFEIPKE